MRPVQAAENSLEVKPGLAIRSTPGAGTRVDKNAKVTVVISAGPAEVAIPKLNELSEDQAKQALAPLHLQLQDAVPLFSRADNGIVINAELTPRGGATAECGEGCSAHQGDAIRLLVSLGPVPDVSGLTADDATNKLTSVKLNVNPDSTMQYSDSVPKGRVIGYADRDGGGNWRPGDTITLTVSQGPEPVTVPDVSGENLADAMKQLSNAGLNPTTTVPDALWSLFTATSTDPKAGTSVDKNSSIRVRVSG
jgi:beta-lactam-binding protein with PASTA domain